MKNSARCAAAAFPVVIGGGGLLFFSRLLADAAAAALPPVLLGKLFFLTLLKYAPQLLTLSIFAGVFLAMRQAFQRREMDAWFCAGLGLRHFIRPALMFALPGALFVGVFAWRGSPWAVEQISLVRAGAAVNISVDSIPRERFISAPGGVYAYFWDKDGDIFIARNDDANGEVIFARDVRGDGERALDLLDGRWRRLAPDFSGVISEGMEFDRLRLALPAAAGRQQSPRARPPAALSWSAPAERAEMVWRLSFPIAIIALALVALMLAPSHPRFGGRQDYLSAIFVFFLHLNLMRFVKGMMEEEKLGALAGAALPPMTTMALVAVVALILRRR